MLPFSRQNTSKTGQYKSQINTIPSLPSKDYKFLVRSNKSTAFIDGRVALPYPDTTDRE